MFNHYFEITFKYAIVYYLIWIYKWHAYKQFNFKVYFSDINKFQPVMTVIFLKNEGFSPDFPLAGDRQPLWCVLFERKHVYIWCFSWETSLYVFYLFNIFSISSSFGAFNFSKCLTKTHWWHVTHLKLKKCRKNEQNYTSNSYKARIFTIMLFTTFSL